MTMSTYKFGLQYLYPSSSIKLLLEPDQLQTKLNLIGCQVSMDIKYLYPTLLDSAHKDIILT